MPASILIVDDEKHTREGLQRVLEDEYDVYLAQDADQAFQLLDSEPFDVVLTDLRMAGKSGMKVIDKTLTLAHRPVCIMMTAYGSVDTAVEAMKRGAFDFLTKPVNIEKLEILIKRALQSRELQQENEALHQRLDQKYHFEEFVGNSSALQEVMDTIRLVSASKATVLVTGETGTGKEMVAQAIHQNSPRRRGPLITVHCAALPDNLLESELFGHEKGAFTGASEKRIGRFEAANGGTLFLDEIGEINSSTQVKLLRFLEQRTFERLGSNKSVSVDVRLVAATNRDLAEQVKAGRFREDLFYRLNVITIRLPSLRERQEDIPVLLDHFIRHYSQENGFEPVRIQPETMNILTRYDWPGNIRELRNFAENIVVLHRGGSLTPYDLDRKFFKDTPVSVNHEEVQPSPHSLSVEENEKRLLRNALLEAKGNRTRAAQLLNISRRTLHRKLLQWPELDTRS
jgi:two-component system response regulator AtoC